MTDKLISIARIRITPTERLQIGLWLIKSCISTNQKFRKRARKIIQDYPQFFTDDPLTREWIGQWDFLIVPPPTASAIARDYLTELERLANDLGLRAIWAKDELHALIRQAAQTLQENGKPTWQPPATFYFWQPPGGFDIKIERLVTYTDSWEEIRDAILQNAKQQYDEGRQKNKWLELPIKRANPTLARNVDWLYQRVTLKKSSQQIFNAATCQNTKQYKSKSVSLKQSKSEGYAEAFGILSKEARRESKREKKSITLHDVEKGISDAAKLLGITYP